MMDVGIFQMASGRAILSDPCYDTNAWCQISDVLVKTGKWIARAELSDEGRWGSRVARIFAVHEDYDDEEVVVEGLPGEVGVDSGQAGIFDLKQFKGGQHDDWYDEMCEATSLSGGNPGVSTVDGGLVSSSGFGDGGYRAYGGRNDDGEFVMLEIVFIDEDDEI
jgi:hypothetical protein